MRLVHLTIFFLYITSITARHILFIGNSLSSRNCFPCKFARASKYNIRVHSCFKGSTPLLYHITHKRCLRKIRRRRYNAIVLQEQSSLMLKPNYNDYAVRYMAKRYARVYIVSTWPHASNYYIDELRIRNEVKKLADKYNVGVIPITIYWTWTSLFYPHIQLTTDGIHPTVAGAYLAACVTSRTLTGKVSRWKPRRLSKETHTILYTICNIK